MRFLFGFVLIAALLVDRLPAQQPPHSLYVALPGSDATDPDRSVRLLVFDIDKAHRFVRSIPLWRAAGGDDAETVRGIVASVRASRLYITTTKRLAAIDLKTDAIVWEQRYEGHCCDRLALSPDGQTIYAPAFGTAKWYVVDAASGALLKTISVTGWPRGTTYSRDGAHVFLAAWESPILSVADTRRHEVTKTVGPFSSSLCPFTVNRKGTLAFANVDGLVGFEVGDVQTGLILDTVAAEGYDKEAAANYECASHGIAFTPDERELWVADGVRNRLHVFDATVYPPLSRASIELSRQPRWIAFGTDGRFAYSSTGDVVGTAGRKIVGALEGPTGVRVESEYFLQIDRLNLRSSR